MKFTILAALLPSTFAFSAYLDQLGGAVGTASSPSFASPAIPVVPPTGTGPSQQMLDLISKQVSVELMASQVYLSASIWFHQRQMDGMAAWMLEESDEERGHGLSILDFANKRGFPVELQELPAPVYDWQTPEQVWEHIMGLEENNTQNLLKIAGAANDCQEFGVMAFLNPFHMEQIEAEEKVGAILAKVKNAPHMMKELDYELGKEAEEEGSH
eukprot:CAMPEP_0202458286 /NCGR_PEP_ID=MMETSP1360-20130828/23969_1 /ASSEMBLY_ACC=CAM_ASM_000848 /TAXON_ID=515479 /ORGANISM="Licmophora paradoxa, Strain CCMP2313" /LENGTH=213 /DNA_ID=CAMNT_0049078757 /DNA_START=28 /DNA_END=669 /DNA_ORIENTATION=-